MAEDAEHFAVLISKYNSGTYNNQWIAVDLQAFDDDATENVMWVMEQIPGKSSSYDATERLLKTGYFPSYNIPSQIEIRQISGYVPFETDSSNDYERCSRKKIFERDAPKIRNIEEMKTMMRYNDYLHDEFSKDDNGKPQPGNMVASRYDLRTLPEVRKAFGAFDDKIGHYNRKTG